jgi:hypothetical protein
VQTGLEMAPSLVIPACLKHSISVTEPGFPVFGTTQTMFAKNVKLLRRISSEIDQRGYRNRSAINTLIGRNQFDVGRNAM